MNQAETLRDLHTAGRAAPLLLRQARDARDARSLAESGADAIGIAVTSLAAAHGQRYGESLAPATVGRAVADVTRALSVPLIVGFDTAPAAHPRWLDDAVAAAIDGGAGGIEIADGDAPPTALAARISAARASAAKAGVDVFVTARTDVYLRGLVSAELAIPATISRGRAYAEAGADAVFAPGLLEPLHIRSIVSALQMPVGVLEHDRLPALDVLAGWGVRRVSEATSSVTWEKAARRVAA